MASAYTAGPVRPGYTGVTHGLLSGSHFGHQSWANNVKDCREYILTFVTCFGHQSCFRWRRLADRHWLRNRPFALVTVWVYNNRNPVSVTPLQCYHVEEKECTHAAAQSSLMLRHKVALQALTLGLWVQWPGGPVDLKTYWPPKKLTGPPKN